MQLRLPWLEDVPAEATITARRKSQPVLGLGFVDAVPDATFHAMADEQARATPDTAGRVQLVFDRTTGDFVVGRFGWKAQVPTLREFSGDALLNEMGITSPGFRDEICPQGDCLALGFNPAPALNDDGHEAEAITDFMRLLAPPPPGAATDDTRRGETVFHATGCAACHRPSLTTGPSPVRALDRATERLRLPAARHGAARRRHPQASATGSGCARRRCGACACARATHDSSAASIDDAVRRHSGQGRDARVRYRRSPRTRAPTCGVPPVAVRPCLTGAGAQLVQQPVGLRSAGRWPLFLEALHGRPARPDQPPVGIPAWMARACSATSTCRPSRASRTDVPDEWGDTVTFFPVRSRAASRSPS
jgi:hypothetical protein